MSTMLRRGPWWWLLLGAVGCGGTVTVYDGGTVDDGPPSPSSAPCDPATDARCAEPDPDVEYRVWSTGELPLVVPGASHSLVIRSYDRTDGSCLCFHVEGPESDGFIVAPEFFSAPSGWQASVVGVSTTTDAATCLARHELDDGRGSIGYTGVVDWETSPAIPVVGDAVWFDVAVQFAAEGGEPAFDGAAIGRAEVSPAPAE